MIADIFYDRNPRAFSGRDIPAYARVFHQMSSLIFDIGLRRVPDAREICERSYRTLCKELGTNELVDRVGNSYFPSIIQYDDACRIYIGEMTHSRLLRDSISEFYRKKLSLAEIMLRQIGQSLARTRKDDVAQALFNELNERLRRAEFPYRYHAGVFQPADDDLSEAEIETPFWNVTGSPMWKSVDEEMKDAFDTRANNGVDPAFHAAKALESTIKIISDNKKWTTGNEKGAANYIDNLTSQKNGRFLEAWEGELLKAFFSKVRNPMGHGKGNQNDPKLSSLQTDWVIDQSIAWIKNLIRRAS